MTPQPSFELLREWEGQVVEILDDSFVAELLDVTAGDKYPSADATIPLADI